MIQRFLYVVTWICQNLYMDFPSFSPFFLGGALLAVNLSLPSLILASCHKDCSGSPWSRRSRTQVVWAATSASLARWLEEGGWYSGQGGMMMVMMMMRMMILGMVMNC